MGDWFFGSMSLFKGKAVSRQFIKAELDAWIKHRQNEQENNGDTLPQLALFRQ